MQDTVERNKVVYLTYAIRDEAGRLFEQMLFRVTRIADGRLTIDANHPLAGQTVKFPVTIAGVRPATLDGIANGIPGDQGGDSPPMR